MIVGPQYDALRLKSLYFIFGAAIGTFFPFINVYYRQIGLSGVQIGMIATIAPLSGAVSTILWGMFNDRFGKTRRVLALITGGALVAALSLSQARVFLLILPLAAIFNMFHLPIFPLLDSTTVKSLGARSADYGQYRVWATIGFIPASAISGSLYEHRDVHLMFGVYPVMMVIFLIACLTLPNQPKRQGTSPFLELRQMLRQPAWLMFAGSILLLWIAWTGALTFLPVMIREMGGGEQLVGWSFTIGAIMEAPVMLLGAPLLKKIGAARLMAIAFACYVIRMFLYAILPSPLWVLAISLLQMVTYGPFVVGSVAYANHLAPAALKSTSQSLLVAILNIGNMLGGLLSGWLFDQLGPTGLYTILTGISLVALGVFGWAMLAARKQMVSDQMRRS